MRRFNIQLFAAGLCVALFAATTSTTARAQDDSGRFKLYIGGIPAGELTFSAKNDGNSYQTTGQVRSTGLIGLLAKVSYAAQTRGTVRGGELVPSSYSEQANTGRREQSSSLEYKNGVPQVLKIEPPRAKRDRDVDPKGQKGTLDPLSMIYSVLRDVDQSQACTLDEKMFDGRRLSEMKLWSPQAKGDKIHCSGVYRRLAGFSAKDMEERTDFRFTLSYVAIGDGQYRVDRISAESLFGKAVIKRK